MEIAEIKKKNFSDPLLGLFLLFILQLVLKVLL